MRDPVVYRRGCQIASVEQSGLRVRRRIRLRRSVEWQRPGLTQLSENHVNEGEILLRATD